jgi:hypothetical protein
MLRRREISQVGPNMRPPHVELRISRRRPLRYAGRIALDQERHVPCVLWDISEGGARLMAARHHDLPKTFTLVVAKFGGERRCQIIWRNQRFVGVKFLN